MVGQFKVFSETQPISVETLNPLEIPLSFGFICLLFKLFRFAFSDYNQAVKDLFFSAHLKTICSLGSKPPKSFDN